MIKNIISEIKNNIKARITARPFDIFKEKICSKEEEFGYWLADDGYVYYGWRFGIFFLAAQNKWYSEEDHQRFRSMITIDEIMRS